MPTIWDNISIILIFIMPFFVLQILLSTRRKWFWSLIVPVLWTGLGVWTTVKNYMNQSRHIRELIVFYLIGDLIFAGIPVLLRYRKRIKAGK